MLNLYDILQKVLLEEVSPKNVNDAIANKYRVIINYSDEENSAPNKRVIEPYAYGLSKAGNSVLRAFQYDGDTKRGKPKWKLFRLDRIQSWQPTKQHFNVSPDENGWTSDRYNVNGDGSMSTVLSQVSFDGDNNTNKAYSPNDSLNKERLKTKRLQKSEPINVKQLEEPKNYSGPANTNNSDTVTTNVNNPNQDTLPIDNNNGEKEAVRGPITQQDNNLNVNDKNFQDMLKRNLDITKKEKDRRGFSLNNK